MSEMIVVTDETFEREVLHEKGTVLVDFGATWCGPCKVLKPIVEAIAREGRVKVAYVDIDAAPETVRRFGVRAAPTLMVFHGGETRAVQVGAVPKDRILKMLAVEAPVQAAP